jgi:hypothetical protein
LRLIALSAQAAAPVLEQVDADGLRLIQIVQVVHGGDGQSGGHR